MFLGCGVVGSSFLGLRHLEREEDCRRLRKLFAVSHCIVSVYVGMFVRS
jgi:hypothetical protein